MSPATPIEQEEWFLTVDRPQKRLEVWYRGPGKHKSRLAYAYPIAIGAQGYETPAGVYKVLAKARNPEWRKPDSAWVPEEERGKVVPGGDPANPLVGSFLKLTDDGIGIHGTRAIESLGSAASHGCIRVHPDVALKLHSRIPTGTLVHIV